MKLQEQRRKGGKQEGEKEGKEKERGKRKERVFFKENSWNSKCIVCLVKSKTLTFDYQRKGQVSRWWSLAVLYPLVYLETDYFLFEGCALLILILQVYFKKF